MEPEVIARSAGKPLQMVGRAVGPKFIITQWVMFVPAVTHLVIHTMELYAMLKFVSIAAMNFRFSALLFNVFG